MKYILTIAGTLLALIAAGLIYIYSGTFNPAANAPHKHMTLWIINKTRSKSIRKRVKEIQVPDLSDTSILRTGFIHYNEMCVTCHGAPGIEKSEAAEGLYPRAPLIYKFASKMKPAGTFWIIKNGIKMTGMPAMSVTHSDDKIWAMTAFITEKLGNMSTEEYKEWQEKYKDDDAE